MRIEIFVVTTEIDKKQAAEDDRIIEINYSADYNFETPTIEEKKQLKAVRDKIIREFGGLTESGTESGYWDDNGIVCADTVKRWLIYTDSKDCYEIIEAFAKRIKEITAQRSQAFGIDGKLFFV